MDCVFDNVFLYYLGGTDFVECDKGQRDHEPAEGQVPVVFICERNGSSELWEESTQPNNCGEYWCQILG